MRQALDTRKINDRSMLVVENKASKFNQNFKLAIKSLQKIESKSIETLQFFEILRLSCKNVCATSIYKRVVSLMTMVRVEFGQVFILFKFKKVDVGI